MPIVFHMKVLGADLAILDEIDSGLDIDALKDVAKAVNGILTPKNSVLMITHYLRLLEFIQPTYIHIMVSDFDQNRSASHEEIKIRSSITFSESVI